MANKAIIIRDSLIRGLRKQPLFKDMPVADINGAMVAACDIALPDGGETIAFRIAVVPHKIK